MTGKLVCVTGAAGYIASHVVQQLLAKGYRVRGTVRNVNDEKLKFLREIGANAEENARLELVEADLLKEGSFDKTVEGCDVVMHTASPFLLGKVSKPQEQLVDPAVKGTTNVLNAVAKAPTVKRVILTSSTVAIYGNPGERGIGHVFTEDDWNISSKLDTDPYSLSKRLAEEAAWELAKKQSQYDLVTINPSLVFGPSLSGRTDSQSVQLFDAYFNGKYRTGVANLVFGIVDVRDVARAHILAMETPSAKGRYITSGGSYSMLEIADKLRAKYGNKYPLPCSTVPKFLLYIVGPIIGGISWDFISNNVNIPTLFDNSKSKRELALDYTPIETTLIDMAESLMDKGVIARKS
eukprot:Opistho-1_new@101572